MFSKSGIELKFLIKVKNTFLDSTIMILIILLKELKLIFFYKKCWDENLKSL